MASAIGSENLSARSRFRHRRAEQFWPSALQEALGCHDPEPTVRASAARTAPPSYFHLPKSRQARVNLSHHGSDEQVFGGWRFAPATHENVTAPNAGLPLCHVLICRFPAGLGEPQPPWQRRTNVWRKATSPARGAGRLRSRQHLVVLIFRGTTMAEQPVNLSTFLYLGVFSRAEQRVLQAIFKGIAEGSGRCVATLARLARELRTPASQRRAMRSPKRSQLAF